MPSIVCEHADLDLVLMHFFHLLVFSGCVTIPFGKIRFVCCPFHSGVPSHLPELLALFVVDQFRVAHMVLFSSLGRIVQLSARTLTLYPRYFFSEPHPGEGSRFTKVVRFS